jgi:hypothetical protein
MKQYSFLLLFLALFFAACEKPIEVDLPPVTTKLAVNAWLSNNKMITVWVGKSRPILQTTDPAQDYLERFVVKDAVPVLYEDGAPFDTLVYRPSDYMYGSRYNKSIALGKSYSVKVTAPGFAEVGAETMVPSQSEIAGLTFRRKVRKNSNGDDLDEITVRLSDPAEKNIYLLSMYGASYESGYERRLSCITTSDPDVEALDNYSDPMEGEECFEAERLLVRDDNFNGREKSLKFYVASYQMEEYRTMDGRTNRPYVQVRRITEDYLKYLKTAALYGWGDNPFAEPVNVFSNVKGGYGIFSAHTYAVDTLRR